MNVDLNVITTNAVVIVPIIIAVVQAIKMMPWGERLLFALNFNWNRRNY